MYRQGVHIDDHEVEGHGEGHGSHQPAITPWRHAHQGLILRQAVEKDRNTERNPYCHHQSQGKFSSVP